jgi:hypothetical protein
MRCATISLIAITILLMSYLAIAQNVEYVGSYETPGVATAVFVSGNYAYVAACSSGLQIINISDPANPVYSGSYHAATPITSICVSGDYAYTANADSGILILNISNPVNPTYVGIYNMPGEMSSHFILGNYAYLANSDTGLQIIDISNPTNPFYAGGYALHALRSIVDIYVQGNYAYLLDNFEMWIINISNPANPFLIDLYAINEEGGNFVDLFVSAGYAYITYTTCGDLVGCFMGISLFNVSDPANPFCVSSYDLESGVYYTYNVYAFVSGHYAFLANSHSGLQILDVSNPALPTLVGSYNAPGACDVYVSGDYTYIVDSSSLQILRFTPTGIEEGNRLPSDVSLSQNYPNPFNGQTTISYSLPKASDVRLDIFDILGRKIETPQKGPQDVGEHSIIWNASDKPSGIYFYRLRVGERDDIGKMVLIK